MQDATIRAGRLATALVGLAAAASLGYAAALASFALARTPASVAEWPFVDDSFYAATIARNVAAGRGPSFDGETSTSGFQPLHVLLLAAAETIGEPAAAFDRLRVVTLALAGFALVASWLLAARLSGPVVGLGAVALWALDPPVFSSLLNGLETALAIGCACLATLSWVRLRERSESAREPLRGVGTGLLLGVAILARIDLGALAVAIALDGFLLHGWRRGFRALAPVAFASAAIAGPWFVWSFFETGSVLPDSGRAVRYLSWYVGRHSLGLPMTVPPESIPLAFHTFHAEAAIWTMGVLAPLAPIGAPFGGPAFFAGAASILALEAAALVGGRPGTALRPIGIGALILVGAYAGWLHGVWYFERYLVPASLATVLAVAGLAGRSEAPKPLRMAALLALVAGLAAAASALDSFVTARAAATSPRVAAAEWLDRELPKGTTVGSFQAGTLGFFSDHPVVNLDGAVNGPALAALRERSLGAYLRERRIDVLVDDAWQLRNALCDEHVRPLDLRRLRPVASPALRVVRFVEEIADEPDPAGLCRVSP